jgi:hypothetical protein
MTHDFKVGDRCFSFGGPTPRADGTNAEVTHTAWRVVAWRFDNGLSNYQDMQDMEHTEPNIFHEKPYFIVPEMPKRKVKRTYWVTVHKAAAPDTYFATRIGNNNCDAFSLHSSDYVGCFPIEIEVEE